MSGRRFTMRGSTFCVLALLAAAVGITPAAGQEYKGLWLATTYPSVTVSADEPVTLELSVNSKGQPPQRVNLSVGEPPAGWKVSILGDGRPITAVFVGPEQSAKINLRIEPPPTPPAGSYQFALTASGQGVNSVLPITLVVGETLPPRLSLKPELPALKGSASTNFKFRVTVKNESGRAALVTLAAEAPTGFRASVTEAFGAREVTTLPIEAGATKDVQLEVEPQRTTPTGNYPVTLRAQAEGVQARSDMTIEISGRPELGLSGPDQRLSARAMAGEESPIELTVKNRGNAPARNVRMSSSPPSGWKVTFNPELFPEIGPEQEQRVTALITPSNRAINGDYRVTMNANGESVLSSAEFRITVNTSTAWGIIAVLIIAAAAVILGLAVLRYGRR
ncbi:MAG: ABC transporter substrate-binding protein [Alphaproteobacteria bacterium]|nr:ABC transporter substrate-binding protein [Alphaproteobacteria bacterium]